MLGLILKVLGFSVVVSIAIKYGAPALAIAPTTLNVLIAIWLPSAIVATILAWRWQRVG